MNGKRLIGLAFCLLVALSMVLTACPHETVQRCGNGNVEGLEQCDDGNSASGDECTSDCQLESEPSLPQSVYVPFTNEEST